VGGIIGIIDIFVMDIWLYSLKNKKMRRVDFLCIIKD